MQAAQRGNSKPKPPLTTEKGLLSMPEKIVPAYVPMPEAVPTSPEGNAIAETEEDFFPTGFAVSRPAR